MSFVLKRSTLAAACLGPNKAIEESLFNYDTGGATRGRKGEHYENRLLLPLDNDSGDFG
jgi:hypothetical protein